MASPFDKEPEPIPSGKDSGSQHRLQRGRSASPNAGQSETATARQSTQAEPWQPLEGSSRSGVTRPTPQPTSRAGSPRHPSSVPLPMSRRNRRPPQSPSTQSLVAVAATAAASTTTSSSTAVQSRPYSGDRTTTSSVPNMAESNPNPGCPIFTACSSETGPSGLSFRLNLSSPTSRRSLAMSRPASSLSIASMPSRAKSGLSDTPTCVSEYSAPGSPSNGLGLSAKVPKNSVGVGIETEFLLISKGKAQTLFDTNDYFFGQRLAQTHNKLVAHREPQMESTVGLAACGEASGEISEQFDKWLLVTDPSLGSSTEAPWPLELVSPLFRSYRGSPWRNTVENCWKLLEKNYTISKSVKCGTHVHISVRRGFDLPDLQKIAQCIIHFEPAIEAIIPQERRGNNFAKSNWLENKYFAGAGKTRSQAIHMIGQTPTRDELRLLMSSYACDHKYAWSFSKLTSTKTIEFRKGAASTCADDALRWAELAMTFIVAAMETSDVPAYLNKAAPTATGLRKFLLGNRARPDLHQPGRLQPFWTKISQSSTEPDVSASSSASSSRPSYANEYVAPAFTKYSDTNFLNRVEAAGMWKYEQKRFQQLYLEDDPDWLL